MYKIIEGLYNLSDEEKSTLLKMKFYIDVIYRGTEIEEIMPNDQCEEEDLDEFDYIDEIEEFKDMFGRISTYEKSVSVC